MVTVLDLCIRINPLVPTEDVSYDYSHCHAVHTNKCKLKEWVLTLLQGQGFLKVVGTSS